MELFYSLTKGELSTLQRSNSCLGINDKNMLHALSSPSTVTHKTKEEYQVVLFYSPCWYLSDSRRLFHVDYALYSHSAFIRLFERLYILLYLHSTFLSSLTLFPVFQGQNPGKPLFTRITAISLCACTQDTCCLTVFWGSVSCRMYEALLHSGFIHSIPVSIVHALTHQRYDVHSYWHTQPFTRVSNHSLIVQSQTYPVNGWQRMEFRRT